MRAKRTIVTIAILMSLLVLSIFCVNYGTAKSLKSHAKLVRTCPSDDGNFAIRIYQYPKLGTIPLILGFGQGYMELENVLSKRVIKQQDFEDLMAVNGLRWQSNKVALLHVSGWTYAEWRLPEI